MRYISLFGGLTVADETGTPEPTLPLQQRAAALLAILAVAQPMPVSRDKIVALLWPETDSESARHSLSQALYRLRTDLGCEEPVHAGTELGVNPAAIRTDIQEFEQAVRENDLERAARLYRGPLLDGFHLANAPEFERWLEHRRAEYRQRALVILESLGSAAQARSDVERVIEFGRLQLRILRTDAGATRRVVRMLYDRGDVAGAMQWIRDHEIAMREELDLDPDPRIIALRKEIQSAHRQAAAAVTTPASTAPAPPRTAGERAPRNRRLADRQRPLIGILAAFLALALVATLAWRGWRGNGEGAVSPPPLSADAAAVEAYSHARHLWRQRTRASLEEAITYFEIAADRDPNFADAFAGLASVYVVLPWYGGDQNESWARARVAADRAIALDPRSAEAYAVRAYGKALFDWEFSAADSNFRTALALRPDDPTIHQWYGNFLCAHERCAEGLAEERRARSLDPLSPMIGTEVGIAQYLLARPDSAIEDFRSVIQANPDFALAYVGLAEAELFKGDVGAARAAIERALAVAPDDPSVLAVAALVYSRAGDTKEAAAVVSRFRSKTARAPVSPTITAMALLGARDRRGAIASMLGAIRSHDRYLGGAGPDPIMDELRGDSELDARLAAAGLSWGPRNASDKTTLNSPDGPAKPLPQHPH